jgi:molybdopterin-dependent oxidoreductase alpha subunit
MQLLRRFWRWLVLAVPFGLLVATKPRHYREMLRVLWRNRGRWRYALRILRHGVCDGCSLGPRGLRDDVIPGVHLCLTRLGLLELNTMPPIPDAALGDIRRLRAMSNEELHRLGRVPYPLLRRPGDPGFRRISWEEAVRLCAESMARGSTSGGDKMAFFVSSRGLTNEAYYSIQKLARIAGTANVDSCARLCHAASASGLKMTIGWGAPTCSLSDTIGTDLLVLIGTDLANNQPVTTKYMHFAKEQGTRIVVVNPFREPALDRYWVPSVAKSALWGTALTDDFFAVRPGGDIAFMLGALKALDARGLFAEKFIAERTVGFGELREAVREHSWDELSDAAGVSRAEMERFAELYGQAERAVLLYSMGLTQYAFGVDNVKMVVNLALARGNIGREKTGIIPIRGHSGVQGTAECGVDADKLPGAVDISDESCARFEAAWGHPIPRKKGLKAAHALDAAARGEIELMYLVGGNFLDTMPDPDNARRGLGRPRVRIHQDIVLNTSTLVDAEELVLVLPAQTRYESGGTSTSTERRVRYSPAIEDPDGVNVAEARAEWQIPALIGRALKPGQTQLFPWVAGRRARRDGAHHAALRRHRGARRRGAVGAVGRRAPRAERLPQHARRSRPLLDGGHPDAGAARGQADADHAARQAVQLDHLRAEGSDHRLGAARRRTLPPRRSARARHRRRRAHRPALRRRADGGDGAPGAVPPPPRAGVLASGQRSPVAYVRSGIGRARLQRRRHRLEARRRRRAAGR